MQIFYRVIGPIIPSLQSTLLVIISPEAQVSGNSGNTSFLLDSEFIEIIRKTIHEVAIENRNNDEIDAVLLWDTMMMQILSRSLKYAREKKDKERKKTNSHQFLGVAAAVVSILNLFP